MVDRVFEDDPTIPGTETLFRRISATWVLWDENGYPTISSAAFKDPELSVYLESVMTEAGRTPADAISTYPDCGLASITAGLARSLGQAVVRDPRPDEAAHGIVYGPKPRAGVSVKLRDGAQWVVTPNRV